MVKVVHPQLSFPYSELSFFFSRLCNVRFTSVHAKLNLSEVTINGRNGDFNPTSLAQVINTDTINNVVVRAWIDRAGELVNRIVLPSLLICSF